MDRTVGYLDNGHGDSPYQVVLVCAVQVGMCSFCVITFGVLILIILYSYEGMVAFPIYARFASILACGITCQAAS